MAELNYIKSRVSKCPRRSLNMGKGKALITYHKTQGCINYALSDMTNVIRLFIKEIKSMLAVVKDKPFTGMPDKKFYLESNFFIVFCFR